MKKIKGFEKMFLAEIAAKDKFSIVDGPFGTQLHASEYKDEGVPVIRVVNTSFTGKFLDNNLVFITKKKAEQLKRSKVVPRDIIIAKTGATIGKSCIFPEKYSYGIIASSCLKLTVNHTISDYRFVEYLIQSYEGQNKIIDGAGGSTRTTINTKPFGSICFLFPPKLEQTKIAKILSTVDRAIEQTEALIAKQQRIKTGLMQDLLTRGIDKYGNIRSEQTHQFNDSPLGRIPVEWDVRTIDELAVHVGSGITPRGGESVYTKEGVLFIRSQNVHFGGLLISDVSYIPHRIHDSMKRSEVFENDVLLNITGASIGRCCYIPAINCLANVNQHVCAIRIDKTTQSDAGFLTSVLESSIGQNQIYQFNTGGNREGLNYQQVRSFVIPWPRKDEREKSFDLIKKSTEAIKATAVSLYKLRSLKTALMQDLLTGKKRVTPLLNN